MLRPFRPPIGWADLFKRTARAVVADNCPGLAAQLAYYFFLSLFPALLFLVALASFLPVAGLIDTITAALGRVAPQEVIDLVQGQLILIAKAKNGGLLTIGIIGTVWSTASGMNAVIDAINQAYNIEERRPFWKTKLVALALTVVLAVFIVFSFALVLVGPGMGEKIAGWLHLAPVFGWTWWMLHWPVVFTLMILGVGLIYYHAPDVKQTWVWVAPGSILATLLWIGACVAFRYYVTHFASYNATYGAIGGIIVALLWFYVSALVLLAGAELNAEIMHS